MFLKKFRMLFGIYSYWCWDRNPIVIAGRGANLCLDEYIRTAGTLSRAIIGKILLLGGISLLIITIMALI